MTPSHRQDVGQAFITKARSLLHEEYLPKIARCLEQLSDEEVWWRANPASNSIGNLLLHLEGNVRQWIVAGIGGVPDNRQRDLEFHENARPPARELLAQLSATLDEADNALARLDDARLLERRMIQGHDTETLDAVFHVVEHFSMHSGQIIMLTKMIRGGDLRFYDFAGGAPQPRWRESESNSS